MASKSKPTLTSLQKQLDLIHDSVLQLRRNEPARLQLLRMMEVSLQGKTFDITAVTEDNLGPLGGISQRIDGVFTDFAGRKHSVVVQAYCDFTPDTPSSAQYNAPRRQPR